MDQQASDQEAAEGRQERVLQELSRMGTEERLWERGDTVLVAVSGGPDSMALLHALHTYAERLGVRVTAAHANHGFRPEESLLEAQGVRRFCEELGIPCHIAELHVPGYLREHGGNKQAAARELRYRFLHEAAARVGAARIAFAHHADDQAETVLMRVLRGTAPSGLGGIPLRRREEKVELIRPLLRITKPDLAAYCKHWTIPYYMDSSNYSTDYFRNAVRLEALPYLESFNGRLSSSLCRLAEAASAESDYLTAQTEELFSSMVSSEKAGLTMSGADLAGLHVALQRRLIKLILDYLALEKEPTGFDEVEHIRLGALAEAPVNWRIDLSRGLRFHREYGRLKWTRRSEEPQDGYEILIAEPHGGLELAEAGMRLEFSMAAILREGDAVVPKGAGPLTAFFNLDELLLPLRVRSRRDGDRMSPLGLNGTKKVQDMFVDAKVPPSLRPSVPLVCDANDRILWIPGIRRSAHATAGEGTRRLLRIDAQRIAPPNPSS
ncbi:tRNA(Ile)-lysidine synthase [Paenibacillaceae bacterium GAS479]|nr:tRNA(Ile)-lysidine synthase [Paenibacillaceae bacterium GAS479]